MAPDVANLIQTVSLELVKIVGPAVVAAYAGYKGALIQVTLKLQELDKSHQYEARESIFSHLKERLAHIDEESHKWHEQVGRMLGFAADQNEADDHDPPSEFVRVMGAMVGSTVKLVPLEVATTLSDMRMLGLEFSDHFKALAEIERASIVESPPATYEQLKSATLILVETYNLLAACTRLLLQTQIEHVLAPYMRPKK
jgi:hypothetical protein